LTADSGHRSRSLRLQERASHLLSAIDLCLEHGFVTPSLILLYATIDIMAWLDREGSHEDVQRSDFVRWVDKYLLPASDLQCDATDLYAARCSVLHSYSAESRLSRHGDAVQVFYAWGTAEAEPLQKLIDVIGTTDAKTVKVEQLLQALKTAVQKFLADACQRDDLAARAQKHFMNLPLTGGER